MPAVFDRFSKQMARRALEAHGAVETDAEASVDTQRVDLWFVPERADAPDVDHLGLLGRITDGPSTLEFFHRTPCGDELAAVVIKHGNFRHFLALRKQPPPTPTQWVISSGRPRRGMRGLCFHPLAGWPAGLYEGPALLWTRLVVVRELPATRDTLLLRLLGAGGVQRRAITELKKLPVDAPERALALPILVRLRLDMPADPARQTSDEKEFLMTTQDIVENWRREAREEGVQKGLERGAAKSLIALYQARFGAMPEDLRAIIDDTHDEATLLGWVQLAGTRGVNEIAEAIRASRPL